MVIIVIMIFMAALFTHFEPELKKGYLYYNYYGRRDKTRTRFNMKKFMDRVYTFFELTIMSIIAIFELTIMSIIAIYTCGFFVLYAGYRDKDNTVMTFGGILSVINLLIIYATLKILPI